VTNHDVVNRQHSSQTFFDNKVSNTHQTDVTAGTPITQYKLILQA